MAHAGKVNTHEIRQHYEFVDKMREDEVGFCCLLTSFLLVLFKYVIVFEILLPWNSHSYCSLLILQLAAVRKEFKKAKGANKARLERKMQALVGLCFVKHKVYTEHQMICITL